MRRLRAARFEAYLPDVEDNRARARAGDPDVLVVQLRPPTAGVWRQYQQALAEARLEKAQRDGVDVKDVRPVLGDPEVDGALFRACVGAIRGLADADGAPVPDGAALWALREQVAHDGLLPDLFQAIFDRASYDEGLLGNCSAPSGSLARVPSGAGTAPTAAPGGSA